MPMLSDILVAIDGSKASELALACAAEEAGLHGAKLHVVYVVETGLFSSLPADNTAEIMFSALEKEGETVLKKAKTFAQKKGVMITTHMRQGHAGNEIITLAEEQKVNLIVVGSHGKSKADRLLLGSVSNYVVIHGIISTLVVRS